MTISKEKLMRFLDARVERLEIKGEDTTEVGTIRSLVQKDFFSEEQTVKEKIVQGFRLEMEHTEDPVQALTNALEWLGVNSYYYDHDTYSTVEEDSTSLQITSMSVRQAHVYKTCAEGTSSTASVCDKCEFFGKDACPGNYFEIEYLLKIANATLGIEEQDND